MLAQGEREALHHQDPTGEGKPNAGTLSLGGEERDEDIACHIVGNRMPVVADLQLAECMGRASGILLERDMPYANGMGFSLGSIPRNVDEHLA